MSKLMNSLTRLGIGIALVSGAANSMLYNGKTASIYYYILTSFSLLSIIYLHEHKITKQNFYLVDGGHRAVIFDRFQGIKQDVIGEGTHFMIPWLHRPIIFDIRTRPRSVSVSTGSKGMQSCHIQLFSY
jgi:hypothetical protein